MFVDVLVVGAGPVGLTMAGELARNGVRCRIIEKAATPPATSRALPLGCHEPAVRDDTTRDESEGGGIEVPERDWANAR